MDEGSSVEQWLLFRLQIRNGYDIVIPVLFGGEKMTILVSIIYVVLGVALAAIILMQEGNTQGLGSIGGMADSYWGKIKGRSMEGTLEKFTKYGTIVFLILAFVLNVLMK